MNTKRILGLGLLVALSACKGSCSCGTDDDDDGVGGSNEGGATNVSVNVTGTGTGGAGEGGGAGGVGTGGEGTGGSAPIVDPQLRFIHLSNDAPAVNFCLLDDGGEAFGPLVEGGLNYLEPSGFGSPVSPGNYSVLVVPADATDCLEEIASFGPFPLGDGDSLSLAAVGLVAGVDATALDVVRYDEALEFPSAGNTTLRFVHAAPGAPSVDIGEYLDEEQTQFVPYFLGASYPNDSGYSDPQELPAFEDITLVARAAGSESDLLFVPGVDGPGGVIVNAYAVLDDDAKLGVGVAFIVDSPAAD